MAYYMVSHLLQGGVPDGSKLGPLKIRCEGRSTVFVCLSCLCVCVLGLIK